MSETNTQISLKQYLKDEMDNDLADLTNCIVTSCIEISKLINEGPILGILGSLDVINAQGEVQQELDFLSNKVMVNSLSKNKNVAAIVSEEDEEITKTNNPKAPYLVAIDPLDGSSNIRVNISVGTIFMVTKNQKEGFFQTGRAIVLSGYAIYGSSNQLVLCHNGKVNFFTLDTKIKENGKSFCSHFIQTRKNIKIPTETCEFAINMSNQKIWSESIQKYISDCQDGENGVLKKTYNTRWIGSMVAEVHRILIRGGIFLYPVDSRYKNIGGRLRLLYEGFPMAHIIETASGLSSTGTRSILDVTPTSIHQRIPVLLGSRNEIQIIEKYVKKFD